jgi:hypothetical protein
MYLCWRTHTLTMNKTMAYVLVDRYVLPIQLDTKSKANLHDILKFYNINNGSKCLIIPKEALFNIMTLRLKVN